MTKAEPARPWGSTRHGTTAGYARHGALGQRPCNACALAKAVYDANRRSATEARRRSRDRARAQGAAYRRLAAMHPEEYAELYADEKRRRGMT